MRIVAPIAWLLVILFVPVFLIRFRKRWVARFNLAVTNRITSRFAGRLPGFGILTHVGRKSGYVYRTPVNVFPFSDVHGTTSGIMIALTYGPDCEWVKNVQAAGRCQIKTRRIVYELAEPTIIHDPTRKRFPPVVRFALFIIGADDFMQLSRKQ